MIEIEKKAENLFDKVRSRFENVSLGDENAKATQNPEDARFFNFDYTVDGHSAGNITLSLIDETSLKVYFSKNISSELDEENKQKWYAFLRELREFAKRNLLSFEPRDITRSTLKHRDIQQQSKADSTYNKDEVVGESRLHGTRKSSYQECGPAKLIIRHNTNVDPERRGARSRHIESVFVENHEGERFKMPFKSLVPARAMARHVSEGGSPYDDLGKHICEMAAECSKLRPFLNNVRRRTFEDQETTTMVEAAFEYHGLLKNTLQRMSGRKGYKTCKEQFVATSTSYIPEDGNTLEELKERFVKRVYNDKMEDALPLVYKAYDMKKNNKFAQQFESWANNVAEGWDEDEEGVKQWGIEPINPDDLIDALSEEIPVGVDAVNAINAIGDIIQNDELVDKLVELAQVDPEADARDTILSWVEENVPAVYQEVIDEIGDTEPNDEYGSADGGMDGQVSESEYDKDTYDEDNVEAIQSAIIRRILNNVEQHSELLRKAGPDGVMNAARDVAGFHAPVDELGSSDISNMVREVYNEVGVEYPEMSEAYTPREDKPLQRITKSPSKKAQDKKYYDYLARTLGEELEEVRTGDDHVNKDVKMKRMGAKPLGIMDKLKGIKQGFDAARKGESEDELKLYNKSKSGVQEGEGESDEAKLERYHELIKRGMDPDDAEVEVFNNEGDLDESTEEYRIDHQGHDLVVQKRTANGWEDLRSFNEMSDDWASTNARNYIKSLQTGKQVEIDHSPAVDESLSEMRRLAGLK